MRATVSDFQQFGKACPNSEHAKGRCSSILQDIESATYRLAKSVKLSIQAVFLVSQWRFEGRYNVEDSGASILDWSGSMESHDQRVQVLMMPERML
jgi:hypothetical protein